jgi:HEAT repeat protein
MLAVAFCTAPAGAGEKQNAPEERAEEKNAGKDAASKEKDNDDPKITAEQAVQLLRQLRSDKVEKAMAAADKLAAAGESVLPYLLRVRKTKDSTARERIARVLGRIDDHRSLKALYAMLEDDEASVRREAIAAIGNLGKKQSIEKLESFLLDKNSLLRLEAAMALGRIGHKAALPVLRRSCLDDDPKVRKAAVVAVGLIGDKSAAPILISVLRDESKTVRTYAHIVLKQLCDADFGYDPAAEEAERDKAVKLWKTWWKTTRDTGGDTRKEEKTDSNKK